MASSVSHSITVRLDVTSPGVSGGPLDPQSRVITDDMLIAAATADPDRS